MTSSRKLTWAAVLGGGLSLSIALTAMAAANPVEERQLTMKHLGAAMKDATGYAQGKTPWDASKAKTLMDDVAKDAGKLHGLFPAGSDTDPKSAALPKVWEDKADFDKRLSALGDAAKKAGGAASADEFKAGFGAVGMQCGGCHNVYRKKQST